jgi:hypothetical protein
MNDGWQVGDFSSETAALFCDRSSDWRMVSIESTDPNEAQAFGSGYFGGCPTCRD